MSLWRKYFLWAKFSKEKVILEGMAVYASGSMYLQVDIGVNNDLWIQTTEKITTDICRFPRIKTAIEFLIETADYILEFNEEYAYLI